MIEIEKIECPACHGTNHDLDDENLSKEWYHRSCTCLDCGCVFTLSYKFWSSSTTIEGKK